MYPVKNGQTSVVLRFKLLDSSSTTGAGLTGLTSASSGLIISTIADNEASATAYTVAGSTIESISTLGTFAAPTATKVRFKEVDATNHKGVYEFQIADARFAVSSAKSLLISVLGATNLAQADLVVPLVSDDPYVAKPTNSNLLSIDGNGRVDVIKIAGTTQTARDIGASVLLSTGTGTGQLDFTSGVVKANATQWLGGTIPAVNVTGVPLVDLKYTLGTISPAAAGSVRADAVTGAVGSVTGAVGSVTGNVGGNVTGSVGSVTVVSDKTGYALTSGERNSIADAMLDRDMSTGADNGSTTVRTVRQALRFLRNKFAIVAGTLTVYKEDDSTTSWTSAISTTAGNPVSSSDPAGP